MFLLADSGSTKTHWALVHQGQTCELATQGLNPRLTDASAFRFVLRQVRHDLVQDKQLSAIYFYGAGCGTAQMQQHVGQLLREVFPEAVSEVAGDLLGACRATCGHEPGVVGILGTGSNLCYYDGQAIARQRVSTGFILGDEGSGNHIGRLLLKDYLEGRMPEELSILFHDTYHMSADEFIDRIYRQPYPNRFLASLASFAFSHQTHEYIANVLNTSFKSFFGQLDYYFEGHAAVPLHLVGGITHSFAPQLRQVAAEAGQRIDSMVSDPMPDLIRYHQSSC